MASKKLSIMTYMPFLGMKEISREIHVTCQTTRNQQRKRIATHTIMLEPPKNRFYLIK